MLQPDDLVLAERRPAIVIGVDPGGGPNGITVVAVLILAAVEGRSAIECYDESLLLLLSRPGSN